MFDARIVTGRTRFPPRRLDSRISIITFLLQSSVRWLLAGTLVMSCAGCGEASSDGDAERLKLRQVRAAVERLPYRILLRRAIYRQEDIAFRGRAADSMGETLRFTVSLGDDPQPLAVPLSGTDSAVEFSSLGFIFNDNSESTRRGDTGERLATRIEMAVDIRESLCRAVTGQPCPPP